MRPSIPAFLGLWLAGCSGAVPSGTFAPDASEERSDGPPASGQDAGAEGTVSIPDASPPRDASMSDGPNDAGQVAVDAPFDGNYACRVLEMLDGGSCTGAWFGFCASGCAQLKDGWCQGLCTGSCNGIPIDGGHCTMGPSQTFPDGGPGSCSGQCDMGAASTEFECNTSCASGFSGQCWADCYGDCECP